MLRLPSCLALALCLSAPAAWAQPRPAASTPPTTPMSEEARSHYEVATRFYTLRRFDDAVREFQTAYALSGRAELLFNIGRANEDGGHPREAIDAFERFLRDGAPGADRASIESRIAGLRARIASAPPPPPPPPPPSRVVVPVTPAAPAPSRALPIGLMVGGGVALATGIVLGVTAMSTHSELASACTNNVCPPEREADISSGRTRAIAADVVGGLGIAALAAGVIVWVVQTPRAASRRSALDVGCGPTGCAASATFRF